MWSSLASCECSHIWRHNSNSHGSVVSFQNSLHWAVHSPRLSCIHGDADTPLQSPGCIIVGQALAGTEPHTVNALCSGSQGPTARWLHLHKAEAGVVDVQVLARWCEDGFQTYVCEHSDDDAWYAAYLKAHSIHSLQSAEPTWWLRIEIAWHVRVSHAIHKLSSSKLKKIEKCCSTRSSLCMWWELRTLILDTFALLTICELCISETTRFHYSFGDENPKIFVWNQTSHLCLNIHHEKVAETQCYLLQTSPLSRECPYYENQQIMHSPGPAVTQASANSCSRFSASVFPTNSWVAISKEIPNRFVNAVFARSTWESGSWAVLDTKKWNKTCVRWNPLSLLNNS